MIETLQGLALHWEQLAHLTVGNADTALKRCAADIYDLVGMPANRSDQCWDGRERHQHHPGETCIDDRTS